MECLQKGPTTRRKPRLLGTQPAHIVETARAAINGWYGNYGAAVDAHKWHRRHAWEWFARGPIPIYIVRKLVQYGPDYSERRRAQIEAKLQAMYDKEMARVDAADAAREQLAAYLREYDRPAVGATLTRTPLGYTHTPRAISQRARKAGKEKPAEAGL